MNNKVRKTNTLDLLRVVAIIMVMTVHCGQYIFPKGTWAYNVTHIGLYGVPIFFALSGYLAMLSIQRGISVKEYYIKRIFRILPSYYVCLLLTSLLVNMPQDTFGLKWFRYFFFVNLFVPSSEQLWVNINGYWCLPVFIIFYALAPLIFKYFDTLIKQLTLCIFSVVIGLLTEYYLLKEGMPKMGLPIFFESLPCFLFGGTISYVKKENKLNVTILLFFIFGILLVLIPDSYILWSIITALLIMWYNKTIQVSQVNKYDVTT